MSTQAANRARWERHYAGGALASFWNRVDKSGGPDACWPWPGCTKRRGYGFVMHRGRAVLTHRAALANSLDDLPPPQVMACHHCDNPVCCNPKHLFWGSHQDNVNDCIAKGRKRGAPRKIDLEALVRLRAEGRSYSQIAALFSVNQASVAKALKRIARQANEAGR